MGPRSVIHPYTGTMPEGENLGPGGGCFMNFPSANHRGHNHVLSDNGFTIKGISHRLQVHDVDLMPALNVGARYIAEGQYIVPDEYRVNNGTQNNNAAHREFAVIGPDVDGRFFFNSLETTSDQSPAVDAWPGALQSLIEPFPLSDGQSRLAYKVTDLGGGTWHYEYAIYNQNMDISVGSLSLPIPASTTIGNIEFFAPVHHAPETNADNYSNNPWIVIQAAGQLTWSTDTFVEDPLANAVRWGTMYNFRFDANSPPQSQLATIGLFKSGGSIEVPTLVPQAVGVTDCNNNGIDDACDLNCTLAGCNVTGCGESVDCDGTGLPDDCEIDCNGNGVADSCDIAGLTSDDCTGNGIPDECESDCNNDGVADFCDLFTRVSSDGNLNGIPDYCEITEATPEPVIIGKSRYFSFVPGNSGQSTAVRVILADLDGFDFFNGQIRWVGPPDEYQEGALPEPTFMSATLQCEPFYHDWGSIELLHITGIAVVPRSLYEIQFIMEGANINNIESYTPTLTVLTGKWGDVSEPFSSPENIQPSINDVLSIVRKWKGQFDPIKSQSQLQPNILDPSVGVNISDVLIDVKAWKGFPYPYDGPSECP